MTGPADAIVEILAGPATLARRVADWLLAVAIAKEGSFSVALSGGATPRLLYQTLAETPYREAFPWSRAHWFWGDERFVPLNDSLSNYRMVQEAMLLHVPVPTANIHAMPTKGPNPEAAALDYEQDLKTYYGSITLNPKRPLFDVVLLGLGEDGHTASLFPGTSVLAERARWAATVIGVKPEPRITLTFPALESTRHAAFLVSGESKRSVLARLRAGDTALPAAHVRPSGALWFFIDAAASESATTN